MRWVSPLAVVFVVLLAACIPIRPHHMGRKNVPEEIPAWLQPGRTTLADVFFRLGEPDHATSDGRILRWMDVYTLGGVFVMAGRGLEISGHRLRIVTVQFDSNGIVTDRWLQSTPCAVGESNNFSQLAGCLPPLPDAGLRPDAAAPAH